jgi:hypothetical protein
MGVEKRLAKIKARHFPQELAADKLWMLELIAKQRAHVDDWREVARRLKRQVKELELQLAAALESEIDGKGVPEN